MHEKILCLFALLELVEYSNEMATAASNTGKTPDPYRVPKLPETTTIRGARTALPKPTCNNTRRMPLAHFCLGDACRALKLRACAERIKTGCGA